MTENNTSAKKFFVIILVFLKSKRGDTYSLERFYIQIFKNIFKKPPIIKLSSSHSVVFLYHSASPHHD